ncbi:hypothetical protein CFOL_v3_01856 [Cephalotus follicularis]|uniref:Uncharacterized protein n=1 Tax=Cephalotus follicularis TaxID=3775 RepID=A0A1Q3ARX3_CEPFO|nr:hypothetical protein CFOL_v3_01856 [Cephalotus follicularis]
MVLVTHQLQGSFVACPSRPLSWSKGLVLKQCVTKLQISGRTERCLSLKCNFKFSVGASCARGLKVKHLKISAFKGSAQKDESGGRANGSKVSKSSVELSYVPKDRSPAIHKLFKKWLAMLRTQSTSQAVDEVPDEVLGEGPLPTGISETRTETQSKTRVEILKVVLYHFWGLDAAIKIPLLIFIPWYLGLNLIYGATVSKELTPLWALGPLIVALYIKMLQGLFALYVFSFKQTVKVIKNLPKYYLGTYNYVVNGKLKEDVRARVWQPLVDLKNLDYKKSSRRKLKNFQEWLVEKYLDFVESIWPYYCRTIRFLKRANLM